jgi:hypothetical protein
VMASGARVSLQGWLIVWREPGVVAGVQLLYRTWPFMCSGSTCPNYIMHTRVMHAWHARVLPNMHMQQHAAVASWSASQHVVASWIVAAAHVTAQQPACKAMCVLRCAIGRLARQVSSSCVLV